MKFYNVTLKIFDVLGREIAILINEEKPAGSYEVEFNGANLTSGIYFYRFHAGNFVETKKTVLMKKKSFSVKSQRSLRFITLCPLRLVFSFYRRVRKVFAKLSEKISTYSFLPNKYTINTKRVVIISREMYGDKP